MPTPTQSPNDTTVSKQSWGRASNGMLAEIYELINPNLEARVTGYGARLVSVRSPDREGRFADVVLGYDSLQEYVDDKRTHSGAVVGRFANRLAHGRFSVDGQTYQVPLNNGQHALHGGPLGFDKQMWDARAIPDGVEFTVISPDGDMGFPGTMKASMRYILQEDMLRLEYFVVTDKPTIVNLTNHAYFNLSGDERDNILGSELMLNADRYTPVDARMIPTGEIAQVAGTPMDFRQSRVIGSRIHETNDQLRLAGGYDHNYILNGTLGQLTLAGRLLDRSNGRMLTVFTTEPGVQFYSGNRLDGTFIGRHQKRYTRHAGLCLETQHFPNSPNERDFPTTLLRPGSEMHSTTILRFHTSR